MARQGNSPAETGEGERIRMATDFTDIELGTVIQAFAGFADGQNATTIPRQFCNIIFERETYLCLSNREPAVINFSDLKLMRELRRRCRAREGTGCPLIRMSSTAKENTIRLDFMFPAMTLDLQGETPILLEKSAVEEFASTGDEKARNRLLDNLVLKVGPFSSPHHGIIEEKKYLIRKAPDFLAEDAEEQTKIVKALLKTGKLLDCRLEISIKDIPFLRATSISDKDETERGNEFKRIHLISLNGNLKAHIPHFF
jgi:hypothetical protein